MKRGCAALVALGLVGGYAAPAQADGPGVGTPAVVSVGDSYISGEAGRWAGNASSTSYVDALGSTAYYDNASGTGESIPGCHRSKSNESVIGSGTIAKDLACSGAKTATTAYSSGDDFKPGLDFYDDGAGHQGQAKALQSYASTHNVRLVVVSIGGNDFNFAGIVQQCVTDFLASPSWYPDYCKDDSIVTTQMAAANVAAKTTAIKNAILNVDTAMRNAGYARTQFSVLVQDYPSPIPNGAGFRYGQSGYGRQTTGGCGFWNADADYANGTLLPTIDTAVRNGATATGLTNLRTLGLRSAFNGRRLCESTVSRVDKSGYASWNAAGALDHIEWFQGIRTVTAANSPYYIQESVHPDYLAQLALRNCVRQAYNGGAVRSGTCAISGTGKNSLGEPNMALG